MQVDSKGGRVTRRADKLFNFIGPTRHRSVVIRVEFKHPLRHTTHHDYYTNEYVMPPLSLIRTSTLRNSAGEMPLSFTTEDGTNAATLYRRWMLCALPLLRVCTSHLPPAQLAQLKGETIICPTFLHTTVRHQQPSPCCCGVFCFALHSMHLTSKYWGP